MQTICCCAWLLMNVPIPENLGLIRILKARNDERKLSVGYFEVPPLAVGPPILRFNKLVWLQSHRSLKSIRHFGRTTQISCYWSFSTGNGVVNVPGHTQSVERCVKIVTEAAAVVCEAQNRDVFIQHDYNRENWCQLFLKPKRTTPVTESDSG